MTRKRCRDCGCEKCVCVAEDVLDLVEVVSESGILSDAIEAIGDVLTSLVDAVTDDD